MTNRENINAMTNEQLAELLVVATEYEEVDYDWDENPYTMLRTQYGNDIVGWYDWSDEAILATTHWLYEQVKC